MCDYSQILLNGNVTYFKKAEFEFAELNGLNLSPSLWMEAKPVWSASAVYCDDGDRASVQKVVFFISTLTCMFIWEKFNADMHYENLKFYKEFEFNCCQSYNV